MRVSIRGPGADSGPRWRRISSQSAVSRQVQLLERKGWFAELHRKRLQLQTANAQLAAANEALQAEQVVAVGRAPVFRVQAPAGEGAALRVADADAALQTALQVLEDHQRMTRMGEAGAHWVQKHAGAVARVLAGLNEIKADRMDVPGAAPGGVSLRYEPIYEFLPSPQAILGHLPGDAVRVDGIEAKGLDERHRLVAGGQRAKGARRSEIAFTVLQHERRSGHVGEDRGEHQPAHEHQRDERPVREQRAVGPQGGTHPG
mgnify:CR=1 FL=1